MAKRSTAWPFDVSDKTISKLVGKTPEMAVKNSTPLIVCGRHGWIITLSVLSNRIWFNVLKAVWRGRRGRGPKRFASTQAQVQ